MKRWMKKAVTWLLAAAMLVSLLPALLPSISATTQIPKSYDTLTIPAITDQYARLREGTYPGSVLYTNLEDAATANAHINYFEDDNTRITFSKAMQGHNFTPVVTLYSGNADNCTYQYFFKNETFVGYGPQVSYGRFDYKNADAPVQFDCKYGDTNYGYYNAAMKAEDAKLYNNSQSMMEGNEPGTYGGGVFRMSLNDTMSCLYTNVGYYYQDGESIPVAVMLTFRPLSLTQNDHHTNYRDGHTLNECYMTFGRGEIGTACDGVGVYEVEMTFINQNAISNELHTLPWTPSAYNSAFNSLRDKSMPIEGTAIFNDIDSGQSVEFMDGFDSLNFHRNANGDGDVDRAIRERYPNYKYHFLNYTYTGNENSLGLVGATGADAFPDPESIDRGLYHAVIATFSGETVRYRATMFDMSGYGNLRTTTNSRYNLPYYKWDESVFHKSNTSANYGQSPYYTDVQDIVTSTPGSPDLSTNDNAAYDNSYANCTGGGWIGLRAMPWTPAPEVTKKISLVAPSAEQMPTAQELYDSVAMTQERAAAGDNFYYYIDISVPAIGSGSPYDNFSVTDKLDDTLVRASDLLVFKRATNSSTWTECSNEWTVTAGTPTGSYTPYTYAANNEGSADFYDHVYRIVLKCSYNALYLQDPAAVIGAGLAEAQAAPTRHGTPAPAASSASKQIVARAQTKVQVSTYDESVMKYENPDLECEPNDEVMDSGLGMKELEDQRIFNDRAAETVNAIGNTPREDTKATITITFRGNGGKLADGSTSYTRSPESGANYTLKANDFVRSGYVFVGWATSATATSITYPDMYTVKLSANTTLYAMWALEADAFRLTFLGNGTNSLSTGNTKEYYHQYVKRGMSTPLMNNFFTRSGYTFLGWYAYKYEDGVWLYTKDGTKTNTAWYAAGDQPAGWFPYIYAANGKKETVSTVGDAGERVYMYAAWQYNGYQIHYEANGGIGTMADTTGATGTQLTLRSNAFTKQGWTFIGWTAFSNSANRSLWWYSTASANATGTEADVKAGPYYYRVFKNGISISPSGTNPRYEMYAQWARVYNARCPQLVETGTQIGNIPFEGRAVVNNDTGCTGILSGIQAVITDSSSATVYTKSATVAANAASYDVSQLFAGSTQVLPAGTYNLSIKVSTKYNYQTTNPQIQIYSHDFTVGDTFATAPDSNSEVQLLESGSSERNYNLDSEASPSGTYMLIRAAGDSTNVGKDLTGSGAALKANPEYCFNESIRLILNGEGTAEAPYYYEIQNIETDLYLTDRGNGEAVTWSALTRSTSNLGQQWHFYQKEGTASVFYLYSGNGRYLNTSGTNAVTSYDADTAGWVLRGIGMAFNNVTVSYGVDGTTLTESAENSVSVRISNPVSYEFDSTAPSTDLPEELQEYLPETVEYLFYGDKTTVTTDLTDGNNTVSIGDSVTDSDGVVWVYDVRDNVGGDTSTSYDETAGKQEIVENGTGWSLNDGLADVTSEASGNTVTTTITVDDSSANLVSYWTPYARVFYEWDEDSIVPEDADQLINAANSNKTKIEDTALIQVGKTNNQINSTITSADSEYIFLGWYPSNDGNTKTGTTISSTTAGAVNASSNVASKSFTMPDNNVYLEGLWAKKYVDYILYDYSQEITYTPANFDKEIMRAAEASETGAGDESVRTLPLKKDSAYNNSTLLEESTISTGNGSTITMSLADGCTAKDTDVLKYTTNTRFRNSSYCGRTIEQNFADGYTVYLIPASNVHYEEDFLTYTGAWTEEGTKAMDDQAGLHPIHGYDAAYAANAAENSAASAKKTTVSASDNNHKASFTFTGNGFDIISRCSSDSGTMLVYVFDSNNQRVETVICDCWLDTANEATYYQIPVVHKTDYAYDTYRVEVYAYYNTLFDHSKATRGALTEAKVRQMLDIPEGTPVSIVKAAGTELSIYEEQTAAKRGTTASGSYSIYLDGIRIYNPLGYTNTENGPLNESSDNYNAAAAYLYGKENEFDPDYVQVRKVIVTGEDNGDTGDVQNDSVLYVASKGSFGLDADYTSGAVYLSTSGKTLEYHSDETALTIGGADYYAVLTDDDNSPLYYNDDKATVSTSGTYQLYTKNGESLYWYDNSEMHKIDGYGTVLFTDGEVDIQGPENEMYLQSGTAIGFQVTNYQPGDTVHISLKSPTGGTVSANVNGQPAASVRSKTEVYYDISSFVTENGIVVITTDAADGNVLSVCNIKVTGRTPSSAKKASVRACSMAAAYDAILGIETEPDEKPTENESFGITSAYLRLNQDINVIYTAKVPEGSENPYMVFTMNGKETTVTDYTVNDSGEYCFAFESVTPQCMGDNISATLYATVSGTQCSDTLSQYSVKTYCENTLARYADNAKIVTLLSDLLTYGSAAQAFTGYKTETMVTDGLALNPSSYQEIAGYGASFSGENADAASWHAASLTLSNNLAVNLIFKADSVEDLTIHVTVNGRTETFAEDDFNDLGNGKYSISYRGILATEFDDVVSASFYVGENQIGRTLNYSVNAYICSEQNNESTPNLAALVRALYNYGAAAQAYSE